MATERQVAANRRNALKSTGPRTVEGKDACRRNALKHGHACVALIDPDAAEARDQRLAEWQAEIRPGTVEGRFFLEQAVAATFQLDRLDADFHALAVEHVQRARLSWDGDRRAEAGDLIDRIAARPATVACRLESTRQGCELMIERWNILGEALGAEGGWGEAEVAAALDLLGVPRDLRRGRTAVDRADGADPTAHRAELVRRQVERLARKKAESLDALDDLARRHAEVGASIPLTEPGRLLMRYQRDAWRRFQASLKAAKATAGESSEDQAEPAPAPIRAVEPAPPELGRAPTRRDEVRAALGAIEARSDAATTEAEASRREARSALALYGPEPGPTRPSAPAPEPALNRRARRRLAAQARRG